ncbi:DUF1854 domain-containing protein [Candidatus Poribacteria bacterium]|nr:DUF1854 domain-containing protein [Candidatus Poribacteria bacterium]
MHFFHHSQGGPKNIGGSQLPLPKEVSKEFHILEPARLRFERNGSKLQMLVEGENEHKTVSVVPLFPLSESERWVSVLDNEGRELGIIEELGKLNSESRRMVLDELRRRYVLPRIQKIFSCKEKFELVQWEVETDRGTKEFLSRNFRENIQQPSEKRLILTDVDGNRYDIPDFQSLDKKSQILLERYF